MVDLNLLRAELSGLYGEEVIRDLNRVIKLYEIYEGKGQDWELPLNMDYSPTKKKTNFIKKLIKEEARFLFGKSPVVSVLLDNKDLQEAINEYLTSVLNNSLFSEKLIKGARDCFIGKRVALKLSFDSKNKNIKVSFKPSLEFVFQPKDENVDELQSIVFFYQLNDYANKLQQRIWKQKYEIINERCILNEGIYDGNGELVEVIFKDFDTGLSFIPAYVIINDGLSGDLKGESDVEELIDNQDAFNKLSSDDIDALRFNMFPMTVATDADEESLCNIKISPGSLVDLQTNPTSQDKAASMTKLESSFNYSDKLEKTLDRLKGELHEVLNIPNISLDQLKGVMTSGKSMKALYWQLITRCEEKFMAWKPALEWMVFAILEMSKVYKLMNLELPIDLKANIENVYPLLEDEQEEKSMDLQAVNSQGMSRLSFIKKWNNNISDEDATNELKQIAIEKNLLEESFAVEEEE